MFVCVVEMLERRPFHLGVMVCSRCSDKTLHHRFGLISLEPQISAPRRCVSGGVLAACNGGAVEVRDSYLTRDVKDPLGKSPLR